MKLQCWFKASPAMIDLRTMIRILKPALPAFGVFVGVWTWNDLLTPLPPLTLGSGGSQTITANTYAGLGPRCIYFATVYAKFWLALIPVLCVYLFTPRFIVASLTAGALK